MRNVLFTSQHPKRAVNNLVIVKVEDTFSGFTTKGGIELVNLTEDDSWGDSDQFNITEFVMRYGTVVAAPEVISKGSFSYRIKNELQPGDIVFWNLISFKDHIPVMVEKTLYLLVDYHELVARERDGNLKPVNGMGLFSPVELKRVAINYMVTADLSDDWIIEELPEHNPSYDSDHHQPATVWEKGDRVKLLVRRSPYKLEGTIRRRLEKELYACPMNYIICSA